MDEEIGSHFYLDGIITVVDCRHVLQHLNEEKEEGVENETVEQIAFADRILLSKVDLVKEEEVEAVKKSIRAINKICPIQECTKGHLQDLNFILGIKAFHLENILQDLDPQFLELNQEHKHDQTIVSVGFETKKQFREKKFFAWLRNLLAEKGVDIFRSKGIVFGPDREDRTIVFQGVHMLLDLKVVPTSNYKEKISKIVFIGRNLNREQLLDELQSCLLP